MQCKQTIVYSLIMQKRIGIFFLLLHCVFFNLYTQNSDVLNSETETFIGQQISDEVQKNLILEGFTPQNINLVSAVSGNYPYNILLSFRSQKVSTTNDELEDYRDHAIIVFGQRDFLENKEEIVNFLKILEESEKELSVSVLFSADGSLTLPKADSITGTDNYVQNLYNPSDSFAIIIRFSNDNTIPAVIIGSGKSISPRWLLESVTNELTNKEINFIVPAGTFLPMYRFGLLSGDPRATSFFSEEIPSIVINFPFNSSKQKLHLFASFLDNFDITKTLEWDAHYTFFTFRNFSFLLTETFLVKCYLIAATATLFILCAFSFFVGKNSFINRIELIKLWYLLPLSIIATFLSFSFGRYLSEVLTNLFHFDPVFQFYIGLQISFLAVSIVLFPIIYTHASLSEYAYKFNINLITLINIFIFSALDLSFFFLFTCEYLIVLFVRPAKRIYALFFASIMLFLPFLPYTIILWQYIDIQQISELLDFNFTKTLFLTFSMQPFNLIWFLVLSKSVKKYKTKKRITDIRICFSVIIASSLIFLVFWGFSTILQKYRIIPSTADIKDTITYIENKDDYLTATVEDVSAFGNAIRDIKINSSIPAERYEIIIQGETVSPVYEATVPYIENIATSSAEINLPDFPPESCTITYTTTSDEDENIFIKAYYATENPFIFEVEEEKLHVVTKNSNTEAKS